MEDPIKEITKLTEVMTRAENLSQELVTTVQDTSFEELFDKDIPELIQLKLDIKKVVTPLEIEIRQYELKIKATMISLKNHPSYDEYTTIKAKEEQVTIDTMQLKELLLKLKKNRNILNDLLALVITTLRLDFILLEQALGQIDDEEGNME